MILRLITCDGSSRWSLCCVRCPSGRCCCPGVGLLYSRGPTPSQAPPPALSSHPHIHKSRGESNACRTHQGLRRPRTLIAAYCISAEIYSHNYQVHLGARLRRRLLLLCTERKELFSPLFIPAQQRASELTVNLLISRFRSSAEVKISRYFTVWLL